jgi:DNA-binding transcriptional regulator LsrR (DeoR family)
MVDKEHQILLVAYYRSLGMKPEEITDLLKISLPTVSRRLQDARDKGYLKEMSVLNIPKEDLEVIYPYLSDYPRAKRFQEFFGKRFLQKVIIVPDISSLVGSPKKPVNNLELIGRVAAVHLSSVLKDGYIVGVSFGRTIQAMTKAARELFHAGEKRLREVQFIPLIGGLSVLPQLTASELYSLAFECSASELAASLALTFKGDITNQLSLPTPAFVPQEFLKGREDYEERIKVAHEFVSSIPEYTKIFGRRSAAMGRDQEALISKMSIMITSVGGPLSESEAGWLGKGGPIIDEEERKKLEEAGVVGDICGHFITMDQVADFPPDHIVSKVNRRVFGPSPLDFRNCAQRALKNNEPGVIMIANSAHKAAAVLSAIRGGCVSTLIIDKELADAMEELEPGLKNI